MKKTVAFLACGLLFSGMALADINVGITISTTGPAASLGIPERNTVQLLPRKLGGKRSIISAWVMRPVRKQLHVMGANL